MRDSTAGMHPHHASEFDQQAAAAFRQLAGEPQVVAMGECGLDHFRNFSTPADQERTMRTPRMLEPWEPSAGDPFDLRKAGHLLRRVAVGGSLELRRRMVRRGLDWAIQRVTEAGSGEDARTSRSSISNPVC